MDATMIDEHLENIDRRLGRLEQILPTLATKDEIKALATKDEIKTFATKDELLAAIAPLATRKELQDEGERSRRHMDVIAESLRSDIRLLAEHLASTRPTHTEPS